MTRILEIFFLERIHPLAERALRSGTGKDRQMRLPVLPGFVGGLCSGPEISWIGCAGASASGSGKASPDASFRAAKR